MPPATSTVKSIEVIVETLSGATSEHAPMMKNTLNMHAPKRLPMAMPVSLRRAAITDVATSGAAEPRLTIVSPMSPSERPALAAIPDAPSTSQLPATMSIARLPATCSEAIQILSLVAEGDPDEDAANDGEAELMAHPGADFMEVRLR